MPDQTYQQTVSQAVAEFPLSITILCYVAVGLLALILFMMFRINGQMALLSHRLRKLGSRSESSSRPSSSTPEDPDGKTETPAVEAEPGTPFEEFLNSDPKHRTLPKKEQFKEYRKWRVEKGLNWSK